MICCVQDTTTGNLRLMLVDENEGATALRMVFQVVSEALVRRFGLPRGQHIWSHRKRNVQDLDQVMKAGS